jgi:predicted amidohydrolase
MQVVVSAIQMKSITNDKPANIEKAARLIDAAVKGHKSNIVLFPEIFLTEFFPLHSRRRRYFDYADPIPGRVTERFSQEAARHKVYLVVPLFEQATAGVFYNSAVVIDPQGKIIARHRKTHIPFTESYEKYFFKEGESIDPFDTSYGRFGVLICYEGLFFPEPSRILASKGASIIFVPFSATRIDMIECLLRVKAYESQVYVVAVNRIGKENNWFFFGNSQIISPLGKVLANAGTKQDAILSAKLDLEQVTRARIDLPLLRDSRTEIYLREYSREKHHAT